MTETEWRTCGNAAAMLRFLYHKAGRRKFRLLACACCRLNWDAITEAPSRAAVVMAERVADNEATSEELAVAGRAAAEEAFALGFGGVDLRVAYAASMAESAAHSFAVRAAEMVVRGVEHPAYPDLVRDVFGNPFHLSEVDADWLSTEAVALARRIYTERRFDEMPRLANVLEAAGCRDADIIGHCRSGPVHTRGCWVLDAVLGKTGGPEPVTEDEWLRCVDPFRVWDWGDYFFGPRDDRKVRLFNCACVRRMWHLLGDERSRRAVEVAERFADGELTEAERRAAELVARDFFLPVGEELSRTRSDDPNHRRLVLVWAPALAAATVAGEPSPLNNAAFHLRDLFEDESAAQAQLARDLLGNPFHPVTFSEEWRTDTVVSLARQMYDSRDFGAMPILADALQDAGCDSDGILNHCRGEGPHVRGCWAVDTVLGKE